MAVNRWFQSGNYRRTYKEDQTIFASYSELASLIALLALLFWLPQAPFMTRSLFRLFDIALIYTVAVMGLNIVTGYAGQISIGQAAFMGVGAYTAAVLARDVGGPVLGFESTIPFWFAALLLPLGGAVAAAVGAFVGLPSLRLKHLYLAIATLAFQVILPGASGTPPGSTRGGASGCPG